METSATKEKELIEEAANAFVLGVDLQDIADRLGCSLSQLKRWRTKYKWVTRKVEFETKLTGTIHMTLEILEKAQVRLKLALDDEEEDLGDISSFLTLVIKMQSQLQDQQQHVSIDPLHIALLTMERFQQYLTENDHAGHEFMAAHIEGFIEDLNVRPLE